MKNIKVNSWAQAQEAIAAARTGRQQELFPKPELTACHASGTFGEIVTCKVWTSRGALAKSVRMQEKRGSHPNDWRPVIPLRETEGYY